MSLFDSFFGTDQETSTTSRTQPWGPAEELLEDILRETGRQFGRPMQMYPGQFYAPQTGAEREQIASLMRMAGAYPEMVMQPFGTLMNAPNVAENPYVQGMAESIQSQVNRNLTENILPQINISGALTGGYGTSDAIARGLAARGTSEVLSESLANLYGNAYGQGLGAQTAAFGMLPGILQGQAGLYGAAGALERGEEQRAIDEARSRFDFAQMEPWQRIGLASGTALPMGTAFSEGTTTGQTQSVPSPFQQIGGLVGAGAMMAPSIAPFFQSSGYAPSQAYSMGGYMPNPYRPWG